MKRGIAKKLNETGRNDNMRRGRGREERKRVHPLHPPPLEVLSICSSVVAPMLAERCRRRWHLSGVLHRGSKQLLHHHHPHRQQQQPQRLIGKSQDAACESVASRSHEHGVCCMGPALLVRQTARYQRDNDVLRLHFTAARPAYPATTHPIFTMRLTCGVTWSSSGGVAICCVGYVMSLPVLWMTSCLPIMARN